MSKNYVGGSPPQGVVRPRKKRVKTRSITQQNTPPQPRVKEKVMLTPKARGAIIAPAKRAAIPGNHDIFAAFAQPNQQVLLPVQCIPNASCFSAAILGALQVAFSQGFEDYAEQAAQPLPGAAFNAYVYMTQILYSYVTNTTSNTIKVPMWLDTLGCALLQTEATFVQGRVSYQFKADLGEPPTLPAALVSFFGTFYMWINSEVMMINDYGTQVAPVTYTSTLGQQAYNMLMQYTGNVQIWPSWRGVDPLTSWAKKDVSAFAVSFLQLGQSINGVGSPLTEIDSEVPITTPLFSVFADYSTNSPTRYFRHARPFAGDANYCGFTLGTTTLKREIKSKIIPKFKLLDFFEFVDVFSLYLAKALNLWYHNTTQTQDSPSTPPVWPLTWLDTCIMLRQAIGACLSPEVLSGQFMSTESGAAAVQFAPFLWGTNCRPSTTVLGLMLPVVFLEGIRCMQGVKGEVEFLSNGKKKKGGFAIIHPILGAFTADQPPEQYEYESSTGVFSPVYTVNLSETAIDLVDCTTGGGDVVNVNTAKLNANMVIWNDYMTNLKANSCAIEALGSDKPPKTLHSIHLTNVCGLGGNDGTNVKKEKVYKGSHVDLRYHQRAVRRVKPVCSENDKVEYKMIPNPYESYGPFQVTSQSQIIKPIWSNWQNMIVLPVVRFTTNPADNLTPTSYLDYSVALNEPYSINQSIGDGNSTANPIETLSQRHNRWASAMVRTVMSDKSSLEEFLCEEGLRGRGGTLGSMLGGLAGSFLEKWIPGATGIGQAIGGLVPI